MRTLIYFFWAFCFFQCSTKRTENDKGNVISTDFQLADSLFPYTNIQNTFITNKFFLDKENFILYTDSTKKRTFVHLDSLQKLKLIVPIILDENKDNPNIDAEYVIKFMDAFFISKQSKIYDFTPLIVSVGGDDYNALFYILLDKSANIVSYYKISGGFCSGPWDGPDSTLAICPDRQSFFTDAKISSYEINEFLHQDSPKRPSIIDSINYLSIIHRTGQIETKKLDSTRYERFSKYQ
ncbi:MAG: hypothetical protein ACT4OJ_05305 [Bacteroidota bacterium]